MSYYFLKLATIVICAFPLYGAAVRTETPGSERKVAAEETAYTTLVHAENLTLLEKQLLEKYNPTPERCRGAVTIKKTDAITSDEGELACMIAGFKQVKWLGPFAPELDALRKSKGIQELRINGLAESDELFNSDFIYYTSMGKQNALLLKEYNKKRVVPDSELNTLIGVTSNDCLIGLLLGYDKKNISAFYKRMGLFSTKFEPDKKEALQWIEAHSKIDLEKKHNEEDALKAVKKAEKR